MSFFFFDLILKQLDYIITLKKFKNKKPFIEGYFIFLIPKTSSSFSF